MTLNFYSEYNPDWLLCTFNNYKVVPRIGDKVKIFDLDYTITKIVYCDSNIVEICVKL